MLRKRGARGGEEHSPRRRRRRSADKADRDTSGVDSEHDYDPFWKRCVELGVAVTAHAGTLPTIPWSGRSISSYSYNHVGNHAMHQAALAKSLVMGGVTRRFPTLNFALLEGGMGWGFQHMQRRNGGSVYLRLTTRAIEQPQPESLAVVEHRPVLC